MFAVLKPKIIAIRPKKIFKLSKHISGVCKHVIIQRQLPKFYGLYSNFCLLYRQSCICLLIYLYIYTYIYVNLLESIKESEKKKKRIKRKRNKLRS